MFSTRQIVAGLTGASLLLSSAPSAFALGLGVGGTTSATSHISLPAGNGHANEHANVYLNGSASLSAQNEDSQHSEKKDENDDHRSGTGSMKANSEIRGDFNGNSVALSNMKNRFHKSISRSIDRIAKIYHRLCYQQDSSDTAIMSCMNTAKAEFKAAVNAMIDASFSA